MRGIPTEANKRFTKNRPGRTTKETCTRKPTSCGTCLAEADVRDEGADTVLRGGSSPRRDDRGSRSLARPSPASQPPEHLPKGRLQRIASHPNVRHQTPLVHAASQPATHTHTQQTVPLSLKGTEPGTTATRARPTPPSPAEATNACPRCPPPTPRVAGRAPAPPLAPGAVTALPTARSAVAPPGLSPTDRKGRVLMQNQRRHYHPRTHRRALSAARTPATHQPAPPNCHCREEHHQVRWRRPGETNARICSWRRRSSFTIFFMTARAAEPESRILLLVAWFCLGVPA